MKYLKLLFKISIAFVGLCIVFLIVLVKSESYETITKKNGNEIAVVEIKKVFGRKVSECPINSNGIYNGSITCFFQKMKGNKSKGGFSLS
jgi:hypothetical protein